MMAYGPATGAVASVPALVSVTLPMLSPFCSAVEAYADKVGVWP